MKWYVLQVFSGQEKKVLKTIQEQSVLKKVDGYIGEVLLPTENVSEIKNGQPRVVEKKLWPGYLLIKLEMNDDSWQFVKTCAGVIDFLGGASPTSLTDQEVEEILHDLKEKRHSVTQKHQFQVGDSVKIVDGVFVNFVGTVTEVFHDKGRLSVLVSIFGRDTRVDDLEFAQVEEYVEER